MLEAKLSEAATLKKLLDSIKELVTDANFECNEEGINLQAMDNSHVALVAVELQRAGFKKFRCDHPMPLGVNIATFTKVLRCAKDDDTCTLKASDQVDVLNLVYESRNTDRIAEYDMKLMDIDSDQLGIPETEYDARVTMSSAEFARVVRDLMQLGESVRIDVSKEGVRFATDGDASNGSVLLKHSDGSAPGAVPKNEKDEDEKPDVVEIDEDDEKAEKVENEDEDGKPVVKKEKDDDVEMEDGEEDGDEQEEFKPQSDDENDEEEDEAEDEDEESGRKRKSKSGPGRPAKKIKKEKGGSSGKKRKGKNDDDEDDGKTPSVKIEMNQHVSLSFSLKYLVNFSKSMNLTNKVQLMMSNDVPLLVNYEFGQGHIRYYLAPKIGDD